MATNRPNLLIIYPDRWWAETGGEAFEYYESARFKARHALSAGGTT